MKTPKLGGPKALSPSHTSRTEAPRPAASAPSTTPSARPGVSRDGFDSVTSSIRGLFGKQSPADSFTTNPLKFTGNNVLNGYKLFPSQGAPQGLSLPTPQKPFVPANQSIATLNVQQQHGNANLSLSSPGGNGPQVHYLHYLSSGQATGPDKGSFAGISGVPLHPGPGQPSMVMTGPLNGCAVHALHNTADDTLSFVHHADFSKYGNAAGRQQLEAFLKENPGLRLLQSLTPKDYSHSTGAHGIQTGATAFAHYDRPTGQWNMVGQLNDWKNGGAPGGRPELQRPQNAAGQGQWMRPVDLLRPMQLSELE